ncbi:DUF6658 family protein [Pleurocapsa sp. FMAR1]|uniref:DUF6658 family protein n=1 Tax=Pleurocapsa sp. FMAR1 TaxID=3040204 RepID=UPI0029C8360E|nr:DUF6658 family protein [Pleurocapsa sp. FMAR1]
MNIVKKLQIKKIASAFVLVTFIFFTTACNSGDKQGARPNVPPVQLGGQNNPHKAGGDGMSQYKSPVNDSKLNKVQDQTNLPAESLLATANKSETSYPTNDNQVEGLLYSDSDEVKSLNSVDEFVSPQRQRALKDPSQIPAVKQTAIDRSDPDNKLLERTKQMFDDAANFSAN